MGMMKQGGPMEQQLAADSVARTGAPGLAALINLVLHDEDGPGCAAALALMRNYPWPGLGCPVGGNTPSDPMASARQQVVETLGPRAKINQMVIHLLARAVQDPAPGVRLAALKALARANRNLQPVLPQLVVCSQDESPAIREWLARSLGNINPPAKDAIPTLTELAQDKEESVRMAARGALETMSTGGATNMPTSPKLNAN